ncbi:MAG: TRAP transporter large permease subunit [Clostridium sp.]|uniref:TRAP transporter large permease subunit n=1 Tax=Clostridium sp. TaxID=1506 RepID=UPI00291579A6|nr:TRAP transporter large permease subunit [Clostridium sp.]MDU7337896.1 TRAP transporter large permease subunit [Clostridium sp.]
MGPGLAAMIVFIAIIIIWSVNLKRNIGEAMFVGMIAVALFGGAKAPILLYKGLKYALNYEVLFASLAFVFMSFLLRKSTVLEGMLHILNRMFGRLKGGPAYVNTALSTVLGCLSGGNTPNAATSGAFTAQWLIKTGWSKESAATLIAANGGLGAGFPPSSSMFIVLAFPTVAQLVSEGQIYVALFVTGIYQVIWRIIYIYYQIHKQNLQPPVLKEELKPISAVFHEYGKNAFIFLGAIIPVLLTMGPFANWVSAKSKNWDNAIGSISILVWIPILMTLTILLLDWKNIRINLKSRQNFIQELIPEFTSIGGLLLFVFAASNIISNLGLSDDIAQILDVLNLSKVLTVLVIFVLVAVVAGPLSSTATLTSVGVISHAILVYAGIDPLAAAIGLLIVASTEGASPPASGALFVACSLTGANPPKIFVPLIVWFVVPITLLACFVALGILPIPY